VRNLAWAVLIPPLIFSALPIAAIFEDPRILIDYWDAYLLFLAAPMAVAAALFLLGWRMDQRVTTASDRKARNGRASDDPMRSS
jgi:hypothetical protein